MELLTTREAAAYLAERGHTIGRPWHGGRGPISARTLRKWCEAGKLAGAVKIGEGNRAVWLIPQEELDRLINNLGSHTTPDTTPNPAVSNEKDAPFEAS